MPKSPLFDKHFWKAYYGVHRNAVKNFHTFHKAYVSKLSKRDKAIHFSSVGAGLAVGSTPYIAGGTLISSKKNKKNKKNKKIKKSKRKK